MQPGRAAGPFGPGFRDEDRLAVALRDFDQHVGKRAIFVVAHRDRRAFEIPLIVRVKVEPDDVGERGIAAELRLVEPEDPIIGLVHPLEVALGGADRLAALIVRRDVDQGSAQTMVELGPALA